MDVERINQIKELGDALAVYIAAQNETRFFRSFFVENRYEYFRTSLIKANNDATRRGHKPLLTLDGYLKVFEEGDEVARADWRLARDLVLIRIVESLYNSGQLNSFREAMPEQEEINPSETPNLEPIQEN